MRLSYRAKRAMSLLDEAWFSAVVGISGLWMMLRVYAARLQDLNVP